MTESKFDPVQCERHTGKLEELIKDVDALRKTPISPWLRVLIALLILLSLASFGYTFNSSQQTERRVSNQFESVSQQLNRIENRLDQFIQKAK
ncbi:MAG: hypothetical protein U1E51_28715 [Candidatus Binatia bacterium]|nr:hypothetical protein [Candidatus Binatia bacterium]